MGTWIRTFACYWAFFLFCSAPIWAQNEPSSSCLKISREDDLTAPITTAATGLLENVYAEAGLCIEWVEMSINRATSLLRAGEIDGNIARTQATVTDMHDVAFALSPPLYQASPSLLLLASVDRPCAPKSMVGVRVGYQMGWVWVERKLSRYDPVLVPLPQIKKADQLLIRQRIEAFVYETRGNKILADRLKLAGVETLTCPLPQEPIYHIVHKRHLDKKDQLSDILTRHINKAQ